MPIYIYIYIYEMKYIIDDDEEYMRASNASIYSYCFLLLFNYTLSYSLCVRSFNNCFASTLSYVICCCCCVLFALYIVVVFVVVVLKHTQFLLCVLVSHQFNWNDDEFSLSLSLWVILIRYMWLQISKLIECRVFSFFRSFLSIFFSFNFF